MRASRLRDGFGIERPGPISPASANPYAPARYKPRPFEAGNVDPGGNPYASSCCVIGSVTISQHKARVAATFRRPTKVFEENLGKGFEFIYQMTLDGMIGSQGGVPLIVGGKLIGAIGCSGGTGPQDLQVCTAGVNALK